MKGEVRRIGGALRAVILLISVFRLAKICWHVSDGRFIWPPIWVLIMLFLKDSSRLGQRVMA